MCKETKKLFGGPKRWALKHLQSAERIDYIQYDPCKVKENEGDVSTIDIVSEFGFSGDMQKKTDNIKSKSTPNIRIGSLVELIVSSLDEEGYAQAHLEGKRVLVTGALPGETVRARMTQTGYKTSFASTVKVLRRSPSRLISSPCSNPDCDGCSLIAMNYSGQLAWKEAFVAEQLRQYSSLNDVELLKTLPSPSQLNYRNTAKLVITGKFNDPVIGIYRRNTHDVVDISECPLHHPLINRIVSAVRLGIKKGKTPIYSARSNSGILRYLVIRISEATNKAMVVFVTAKRSFNEIHHLSKFVQEMVPEISVSAQNVNSSEGNVILGDKDFFITKEQSLSATIGPIKFTLSPRSFFQVNGGAAALIYETVKDWANLTGKETVADLYCGIGGISLFLADKARETLGIEVVKEAVSDAERNSRLNGKKNCRFAAGDVEEILDDLIEENTHIDLVVINPPRKGCERKVLERIASIGPNRIIYVSCSPITLARDLDILSSFGYMTNMIQPIDMFPQTLHIESGALHSKM